MRGGETETVSDDVLLAVSDPFDLDPVADHTHVGERVAECVPLERLPVKETSNEGDIEYERGAVGEEESVEPKEAVRVAVVLPLVSDSSPLRDLVSVSETEAESEMVGDRDDVPVEETESVAVSGVAVGLSDCESDTDMSKVSEAVRDGVLDPE